MPDEVKFPDRAIGDDDLLSPTRSILTGIDLLGGANASSGGAISPPAQSVAIIEANATALAKGWAVVVAALGGATAITSSVTGIWIAESAGVRIALVAGTAAVLVAVSIALGLIISSDVRGRAEGAGAIYAARAAITVQFLREAYDASARGAAATPADTTAAITAATKDAFAGLNTTLTGIHQQLATLEKIEKERPIVALAALER